MKSKKKNRLPDEIIEKFQKVEELRRETGSLISDIVIWFKENGYEEIASLDCKLGDILFYGDGDYTDMEDRMN